MKPGGQRQVKAPMVLRQMNWQLCCLEEHSSRSVAQKVPETQGAGPEQSGGGTRAWGRGPNSLEVGPEPGGGVRAAWRRGQGRGLEAALKCQGQGHEAGAGLQGGN
jgi:hypothetical protein